MCQPSDTMAFLKEQIALANMECKADQMRLILGTKTLADADTVAQHELANEGELYVVFQISDSEWESVQVEDMEASMASGS